MAGVIENRLRVLAVGIRPTLAAECGLRRPGTADILDAAGISGWQIGIRQIAAIAAEPQHNQIVAWVHAELRADAERWRYLAAFVRTLASSAAAITPYGTDDQEVAGFWLGWHRNMTHARDLLLSSDLIVSPAAIRNLDAVASLVHDLTCVGELPTLLGDIRRLAARRITRNAGLPAPLVLPAYRRELTIAFTGT